VLLLAPRLLDTAGGRACTDLAKHLDRRRYEPLVCCYAGWGPLAAELERAGVEIFPLRRRRGLDPGFVLALAREIRARRVEVVHTLNSRAAYVSGVAAGVLGGVRAGVATFRELPDLGPARWTRASPWLARAGRLCGEVVGAVIATTDGVADELLRQRWVPPGKVLIIPDGVDVARFQPADRRAAARALWGVPEHGSLVGAVLDPVREDERARLVEALALLRVELPGAMLAVVGIGGRGAGWIGLGPFADSPAFYAAIDALALPYGGRAVPLELLEALAAGVPVAASRAPGENPLPPEGPWAFASLSPPGAVGLAAGLLDLLRDPESARGLVRGGARCVADGYSIASHVERIMALYDEACEQ
jgi:glycosyltransferase involved in cell wall biosynthesis